MKVQIYVDELYPFYGFHVESQIYTCAPVLEVSEETLKRWQQIMEAFNNLQEELEKLRNGS